MHAPSDPEQSTHRRRPAEIGVVLNLNLAFNSNFKADLDHDPAGEQLMHAQVPPYGSVQSWHSFC
jgi:hypothetical protein